MNTLTLKDVYLSIVSKIYTLKFKIIFWRISLTKELNKVYEMYKKWKKKLRFSGKYLCNMYYMHWEFLIAIFDIEKIKKWDDGVLLFDGNYSDVTKRGCGKNVVEYQKLRGNGGFWYWISVRHKTQGINPLRNRFCFSDSNDLF